MGKNNSTVADTQLKARRTSLGKKSNEELINIILRKDKTERSQSAKINSLMELLNKANALNEEKDNRILSYDKDIKGMEDIVKVKQEQIDILISDKKSFEYKNNEYCKEIIRLKELCNIRRNVIFTLFAITTIAILIVVLG